MFLLQTTFDGQDPEPIRHQVWELPPIKPIITEYQQHRLTCSCGKSTVGNLPDGVPTGQAGPRLVAFTATLMGLFRQSKRRAALFLETVLNIPASPAWVVALQKRAAEAMKPAYEELKTELIKQKQVNIDESPTKQGKLRAWIWSFVAATFTIFTCRTSRKAEVPQEFLGKEFPGIINCDRARMYWSYGRLQWCWAHLQRDFQSWSESTCTVRKRLGKKLLTESEKLFRWWSQVRDGTINREEFQRQMIPIRQAVNGLLLLLRGYWKGETHTLFRDLANHEDWLWNFVDQEGIEPTNNAAERSLRHAVIWRKRSYGTQSEKGSRFVERILTAVETCRQQKRNVLEWLTQTVQANFHTQKGPSLLPGA